MKKILFASVLALSWASPVWAADLPTIGPSSITKAVAAVPAFPWQSCYLAGLSGNAMGSDQTGTPTVGALVGCNFVNGSLLYGFEGDASAAQATLGTAPRTVDIKGLGNLSLRAGYVWRPLTPVALGPIVLSEALLYAKAGVPADFVDPTNRVEVKGWALSGGIEFPIRPYTTAGYEYRFIDEQGRHSHQILARFALYSMP